MESVKIQLASYTLRLRSGQLRTVKGAFSEDV